MVLILKQPYHFGGKIKGCIHHCPASTNVYSAKPTDPCKKARKIAPPQTNHSNTVESVVKACQEEIRLTEESKLRKVKLLMVT